MDLEFEERGFLFVRWMRKFRAQYGMDDKDWLTRWAWKLACEQTVFDVQARPEFLARNVPLHGGVKNACGD